jgi:hypothetical protein
MELVRLARLPFFHGMPQWALIRLAEVAAEGEVGGGRGCCFARPTGSGGPFLLAGSVQILIRVGEEDLLVAVLGHPADLVRRGIRGGAIESCCWFNGDGMQEVGCQPEL